MPGPSALEAPANSGRSILHCSTELATDAVMKALLWLLPVPISGLRKGNGARGSALLDFEVWDIGFSTLDILLGPRLRTTRMK